MGVCGKSYLTCRWVPARHRLKPPTLVNATNGIHDSYYFAQSLNVAECSGNASQSDYIFALSKWLFVGLSGALSCEFEIESIRKESNQHHQAAAPLGTPTSYCSCNGLKSVTAVEPWLMIFPVCLWVLYKQCSESWRSLYSQCKANQLPA